MEDWLKTQVDGACGGARSPVASLVQVTLDYLRFGRLGRYIWLSRGIPGWTRGDEAVELARVAHSLGNGAVIVEIGAFLGCSTVLLAGARKLRGSGIVHTIDPFDASGDPFSTSIYRAICDLLDMPLRQAFEENINRAGVCGSVKVHQGTANEVVAAWASPINMLFLDGDQSYEVVRATHESWAPHLVPGGIIAVHNSAARPHHKDHDGPMRLVLENIHPPEYSEIRCVGTTTFARKQ